MISVAVSLSFSKLDDTELQIINCATEDELLDTFEKVYSRILYTVTEEDSTKVKNFKVNLQLIKCIKEGQLIIVHRELGTQILIPPTPKEYRKKYYCDPQLTLEDGIKDLLKGLPLTEVQIFAFTTSGPINLHETFEYIYYEKLSSRDEDLGENFRLNMYNLLSLMLSNQATVSGVEIPSISREQYEEKMTKKI